MEEDAAEELEHWLSWITTDTPTQSLIIAVVGVLAAIVLRWLARRVIGRLAARTRTRIDDVLVKELGGPFSLTIAFLSLMWAVSRLELPDPVPFLNRGFWLSASVLAWTYGGHRIIHELGVELTKHQDRLALVQARTLPLFDMFGRLLVYGVSLYFFFLAWEVDLTAWVASAGVVGLAVGFAAQETLGNMFAGLAIIADAPYKIGDYLELESGVRGRVTEIGLRVTRLVTPDDVEIVIPNRTMAGSNVVNESGGPYEKTRIRVAVGVAYGSDIDQVKRILIEAGRGCELVLPEPKPMAMFRAFGDSSLDFELMVWAPPARRPQVLDVLNSTIYRQFAKEGVEIPFPQRDLHLKAPLPPLPER